MTLSVIETVQIMGEAYRSIQLKVLAFRNGNKLQNIMTLIQFSMDHPSAVVNKEERQNLLFVEQSLPIEALKDIRDQIISGKLIINPKEYVEITAKDINPLNCTINWLHKQDPNRWLELVAELKMPSKLDCQQVERACRAFSLPHLQALKQYKFGTRFESPSIEETIRVVLPVYAKIASTSLDEQGIFNAKILLHEKIAPVALTLEQLDRQAMPVGPHKTEEIPASKTGIAEYEKQFPINLNSDQSNIKISLFHTALGIEIDYVYESLREIIVRHGFAVPILFRATNEFLKKDDLLKMLTDPTPQRGNRRKIDTSEVFELGVHILLSVGGLSTVTLGPNEVLRSSVSKSSGSADILAYDPSSGTLFVISCKAGITDKNSIDQIITTSRELERRLECKHLKTIPCVFTSTDAPLIKQEASKLGVLLFDKQGMQEILKHAQVGKLTLEQLQKI
ncbi:MAG: hypothetical protein HY363_04995 [Candidatus Aenigmarchaeota archaeon]|nr:hypothetical protein [Candidatus Aenigmarchaeota archaeon]